MKISLVAMVIISLLIVIPTISALDVGITSVNITTDPFISGQNIDLDVDVTSDNNTDTIIKFYADTDILQTIDYTFDSASTVTFNLHWLSSQKFVTDGNHALRVTTTTSNDDNSSNNTWEENIYVYKGYDIYPISVSLSNYSPDVGETVTITTFYKNQGDLNPATSFTNCVYINNDSVDCWVVDSAESGTVQQHDTNYTIPELGSYIVKFVVDTSNEINEFNETNNEKESNLGSVAGIDLSISSSDIIIIPSFRARETSTVETIVRNIGQKNATNVKISAYGFYKSSSTLIREESVNIDAIDYHTFTFDYTPAVEGIIELIITVDRDNIIVEDNEGNNEIDVNFAVAPPNWDSNAFSAYTLFFEIRNKCNALISNGDRFISDGIIEEDNIFKVKYKLVNATGSMIIEGEGVEGDEINKPGVTLRILEVDETLAYILMIYQQPYSLIYNECKIDVEGLISEIESAQKNFETCQDSMVRFKTENDVLESFKNNQLQTLSTCQNDLQRSNSDRDTCKTNATTMHTDCEVKTSEATRNEKNSCEILVNEKNDKNDILKDEIETWKTGSYGLAAFIMVAVLAVSAFLILKKREELTLGA